MKPENRRAFESLDPKIIDSLVSYTSSVIPPDLRLVTGNDLDKRANITLRLRLAHILASVPALEAIIRMRATDQTMQNYGIVLLTMIIVTVVTSIQWLNVTSSKENNYLEPQYRDCLTVAGNLTRLMPELTLDEADKLLAQLLALMGRGQKEA